MSTVKSFSSSKRTEPKAHSPERRWQIYAAAADKVTSLSQDLGFSPLLIQLLINRGLSTPEAMRLHLSPRLEYLCSPFEIPDMDKAVARLLTARDRGEKVIVYGDYDCDGITGTAQVVTALRLLGVDVRGYLPHRFTEGYGLNLEAVQQFARDGVHVIVTVDCGVGNVEEIRAVKDLGMDILITDHHTLPDPLPPADAVVHPKRIEGPHPSKHLSGAGVGFKLAMGLLEKAGQLTDETVEKIVDLAAIGTIGDIVPLVGENRIIVAAGLSAIQKFKRPGLKALFQLSRLRKLPSVRDISFHVIPRINVAGRLEHPDLALELLLTEDPLKADRIARELDMMNKKRRTLGDEALQEAELLLQGEVEDAEDRNILLVSGEGWHIGVLGIIAARLVDKYYRPAILVGSHNGVWRGSARSVEGFDIHELLSTCEDLFVAFGGHKGAAGFEIMPENLPKLRERIQAEMARRDNAFDFVPKLKIDAVLTPDQISLDLAHELEMLAPFGLGNPEPLFLLPRTAIHLARTVGSGAHLKLSCSLGGSRFDAVGFRMGSRHKSIRTPMIADLACHIERDTWNGTDSLLVKLADLRVPVLK